MRAWFLLVTALGVGVLCVAGVRSAYRRDLASLGVTIGVLGALLVLGILSAAFMTTMMGPAPPR